MLAEKAIITTFMKFLVTLNSPSHYRLRKQLLKQTMMTVLKNRDPKIVSYVSFGHKKGALGFLRGRDGFLELVN